MWITVLVLAGSVIFEPIRLGLVVLLLGRRRAILQLFMFLCGGVTMGGGVGLVVLFILRAAPVVGQFTVTEVQIVSGLIALLIAVVLARNPSSRELIRRASADASAGCNGGVSLLERTPPGGLYKLTERTRYFLQGDSLYVAAVSGLVAALPSANYMGSLAAILASHAEPVTQAQALLTFNLVAFAMAEIPLVSYLAAPRKTRMVMAALQTRLRSRSHRDIALVVAAGGCLMLALGLSNL